MLFSIFLLVLGKSPVEFFALLWRGGFGTAFSVAEHAGQRAAPLILTALCVAIPARLGLVMIGGEGALVLGGFAAAAIAIPLHRLGAAAASRMPVMVARRRRWPAPSGSASSAALRHYRGVNETISSLLLSYIAIAIMNFFVEGALRDPAIRQQAVDHADRRRQHGRHDPRHSTCIGASPSASCSPSCSGC